MSASPEYPPMINIMPRAGAPVPSPPVSRSCSNSMELDMPVDENPPISPTPSMFDHLANEAKTMPARTAVSPPAEPEFAPQPRPRRRSRPRPRQRLHARAGLNRGRRARGRRAVASRSRSRSRMRSRMRSRSRSSLSNLSAQNRFGGVESDHGSVARCDNEPAPRTPPVVSTETRAQKVVRIEANLVAMRMDVRNLETLTDAELDALDEKLKAQSSRENILKLMRRMVTLFATLVEHAHTQFNSKNKHLLEGWSQEVYHGVLKCEYDHHLLAIYDYYSPRAVLHPVLGFALALGGSACMYAITRHFMETGLESMRGFVSTPDFATNVRQTFQDSKTQGHANAPNEPSQPGVTGSVGAQAQPAPPGPPGPPATGPPDEAPVRAAPAARMNPALVADSAAHNPMMNMIGSVLQNPGGLAPMIDTMVGMMGQQSQLYPLQPQLAPAIGGIRASMAPFAQPPSLAAGPPATPVLGTMSPPPPPRSEPAANVQSSQDMLNRLRSEERAHFAQSQPGDQSEGQPVQDASSPDAHQSRGARSAQDVQPGGVEGVLNIMIE